MSFAASQSGLVQAKNTFLLDGAQKCGILMLRTLSLEIKLYLSYFMEFCFKLYIARFIIWWALTQCITVWITLSCGTVAIKKKLNFKEKLRFYQNSALLWHLKTLTNFPKKLHFYYTCHKTTFPHYYILKFTFSFFSTHRALTFATAQRLNLYITYYFNDSLTT